MTLPEEWRKADRAIVTRRARPELDAWFEQVAELLSVLAAQAVQSD